MKKLLFLLLSAAVAVSASAGVKTSINKKVSRVDNNTEKVMTATRANGMMVPGKVLPKFSERTVLPVNRATTVTWDFEDTTQLEGFAVIDADGDGYGWSYSDTILTAHSGNCCLFSNSYVNNVGALNPDNWVITPLVTLGTGVEVWAVGQDPSYPAEVFAIYVAVGDPQTTDDFVKVSPDFTATGEYTRYSADLSAYAGQTGCVAIRHYNVTDQFILNIDDITIGDDVVVEHYPTVPESLTVDPAARTAYVEWVDEDDEMWNLRYRPYVDTSGNPISVTLPEDTYMDELEGWAILDHDGDGQNWKLAADPYDDTNIAFESDSYYSGVLTPDNWLISPLTELKGEARFKIWHYSSYPEKMEVLIGMEDAIDGSTVDVDAFTNIASYETEGNTGVEKVIDLSSYNGAKGYVVFRHYGTSDQWRLFLDDIFIGDPNAEIIEKPEWQYAYDIEENHYLIEGLTPETEYEVQVQTTYNGTETDWTDVVYFTTLPEGGPVVNVGDVNKDGTVNIADVTALIDALLSGDVLVETDEYSPDNADVDESGTINISDVTALIDMLLQ